MQRTPIPRGPRRRTGRLAGSARPSRTGTDTLAPGQRLFDRYRLEAQVGHGGMARVWRATDERLQRSVAIKVLHPRLLPDASWRRRFVAEARAASGLSHPGIVSVYDVIDDPLTPAIVFQYVDGETLADRLRRDGTFPVGEATRVAAEIAAALAHAHAAGVIHRDVKPANVLLDGNDGRARLADFGIARVEHDQEAEVTAEHHALGTLRYMAPEQLAGGPTDARTDLYALGLLIAEMVPDLGSAPAWLGDLVGRLRAPDPADRPSSAADVGRALETGELHDDGREGPADPTVDVALALAAAPPVPIEPTVAPPVEAVAQPVPAQPLPRRRRRRAPDVRPLAAVGVVAVAVLAAAALMGGTLGRARDGASGPGPAGPGPTAFPVVPAPLFSEVPSPTPKEKHGNGHGPGG